jgi:hypothetical protein
MAVEGQPAVERLRAYLRELTPGVRALLISELERALRSGDKPVGLEMVLAELRRGFDDGNSKSPGNGAPARMFFEPFEPFLVDDLLDHKHRGRIARGTLEPLWSWLQNTVMPEESRAYSNQLEEALVVGDTEKARHLARDFQDRAAGRIAQMLKRVEVDDKERRNLAAQFGSPRALEVVRAPWAILNGRESLAALGTRLPARVDSFSGPLLNQVKAMIDTPISATSELFQYSLVLAMSRLAAPWQLIRLAIKAAGGDVANRVAATPYAEAVNIVIDETGRKVRGLAADLKSGRGVAVSILLKEIHDALRGMRSELDLPTESAWGRQLTSVRAEASSFLTAEIELMPGRVRRLIRPRSAREIVAGSTLDLDDVADTEALIGFVMACRNYASELAINEVTQRTCNELREYLDTNTRALVEALRNANPAERRYRQSQVDAAVRFCGKAFGEDYAAMLGKAVKFASQGERKAAGS